jgi:hypothetical protein
MKLNFNLFDSGNLKNVYENKSHALWFIGSTRGYEKKEADSQLNRPFGVASEGT